MDKEHVKSFVDKLANKAEVIFNNHFQPVDAATDYRNWTICLAFVCDQNGIPTEIVNNNLEIKL